jgi:trehalose synthase-fused probable maltokinase
MAPISLSTAGASFFDRPESPALLEREILPSYIPRCRWFGGKARQPKHFTIGELLPLGPADARLVLVQIDYADGLAETYQLPLQIAPAASTEHPIAAFNDGTVLRDALHDEAFRAALLSLIARASSQAGAHGNLRGHFGHALPPAAAEGLPSKVLAVEQSNSSLNYDDQLFVKLFRKLEDGLNPDVEITRFLSDQCGFTHVPPFAGAISYTREGREPQILALAVGLVKNDGDAWTQALAAVGQYLALVRDLEEMPQTQAPQGLLSTLDDSEALRKLAGPFADRVARLGQRTAETHLALASEPHDPAFAPEPFTGEDQRALSQAVAESARKMFTLLRERATSDPVVSEILASEKEVLALASRIGAREVHTAKIRTHGDYHLGQVLSTGDDFILLDFEGEPQRSLAERKDKRSPLRDVAGMLRSFHYAAHSGLNEFAAHRDTLTPWAEAWSSLMARTFLRAWLETAAGAVFLPPDRDDVALLLHAFLLEKAIYEVGYELNNRPTWLHIPLRGILQILASEE